MERVRCQPSKPGKIVNEFQSKRKKQGGTTRKKITDCAPYSGKKTTRDALQSNAMKKSIKRI